MFQVTVLLLIDLFKVLVLTEVWVKHGNSSYFNINVVLLKEPDFILEKVATQHSTKIVYHTNLNNNQLFQISFFFNFI